MEHITAFQWVNLVLNVLIVPVLTNLLDLKLKVATIEAAYKTLADRVKKMDGIG